MNPRTAELLRKMQEDADEVPLVQLGDASIAAPFTSKGTAVTPIAHIIRQVIVILSFFFSLILFSSSLSLMWFFFFFLYIRADAR
jgi:hypothetical protein